MATTPVDLAEWQRGYTSKLEGLQTQVTDLIDTDSEYLAELGSEKSSLDFFARGIYDGDAIITEFKDTFKNELSIALDSITDVQTTINNIVYIKPDKPSILVNPTITRYDTHVFSDNRLDGFEIACRDLYSTFNNPTAFTFNSESTLEAIQTALYDYELGLDEIDVQQDIEKIASKWASNGYTQVSGAMSYDIGLRLAAFDKDRTGKTRDIFKGLAGIIEQNLQWSFENGISIEKLHADFANQYSSLSKQIIGSAVDAYVAEVQKRVQDLEAQLTYTNFYAKAKKLRLDKQSKEFELELKENAARLSAYVNNVNTFIQAQSNIVLKQIQLGENIANGYSAIFNANASSFTGIVDETQTLE